MQVQIEKILSDAATHLERLRSDPESLKAIGQAAVIMGESLKKGGKIISCGNGGSLCDAQHFAEELTGRFRKDRPALAALCINDAGHMSCTANDMGWDEVFSRYVEAHGRPGDVLLGISTSGKSPNVLHAAAKARDLGLKVIALTGAPGTQLESRADLTVAVGPAPFADRIQELHIKIIHIWIGLIERQLFPKHDFSEP